LALLAFDPSLMVPFVREIRENSEGQGKSEMKKYQGAKVN